MNVVRSRGRFLLLLIVVYAADVALTLAGQPAAYWRGDYGLAVEANPLAYPLLVRSPWAFVVATLVWGVCLAGVVWRWRHRAGEWLALLLTIGHAVGGASWLARLGAVGWAFALAHLVAVTLGIRWCRHHAEPADARRPPPVAGAVLRAGAEADSPP